MSERRRGVFIDRDGTLNEERDYISRPEDLHLIPGAGAAIRRLNEHSVITCVISNQSGVGRGFFPEANLVPIHRRLEEELKKDGALLDRIYYCPHHPTEGRGEYRIDCACRKPKPGMLERAAAELGLDLGRSFVIGDSLVDLQAGAAVRAATILVLTGYGEAALEASRELNLPPAHVAPTIVEAVDFIIQMLEGEKRP